MSATDTVYVPSLVTSAVPAVHSVTVPSEPSVWPVASIIEGYQSASAYIRNASYCADAATAIVPATDGIYTNIKFAVFIINEIVFIINRQTQQSSFAFLLIMHKHHHAFSTYCPIVTSLHGNLGKIFA